MNKKPETWNNSEDSGLQEVKADEETNPDYSILKDEEVEEQLKIEQNIDNTFSFLSNSNSML